MDYEFHDEECCLHFEEKPKRKNEDKIKNSVTRQRVGVFAVALVALGGFVAAIALSPANQSLQENYDQALNGVTVSSSYSTTLEVAYTSTQTYELSANTTQAALTMSCVYQWQYGDDAAAVETLGQTLANAPFRIASTQVDTFGELQTCLNPQGDVASTRDLVMERTVTFDVQITEAALADTEALGLVLMTLLQGVKEGDLPNIKRVKVLLNGKTTWDAPFSIFTPDVKTSDLVAAGLVS
jgi:nitrogen fixation/metabolism regulation signal transduction histidine kinase